MSALDLETVLERFVSSGRIVQFPSRPAVRRMLLEHVARTTFATGDVLTEREVNDRLGVWHDDVALLRRYLVDHGMLNRTASGSSYALPQTR